MIFILGAFFLGALIFISIFMYWIDKNWNQEAHKVTTQWQQDFSSLFIFLNSKKIFLLHCALSLLIPIGLYFIFKSAFLSMLTVSIMLIAPKHILHYLKAKRLLQAESQLPDTLMQIASNIKSGSSIVTAFEFISQYSRGPLAQEFSVFVQEYRMGITIEQALNNLDHRIQSESLSLAITTMTIAHETGGNLAEPLERLSHSIRQKIMIEKKIKSLTSQGKLQGIVIGLLPVGIGAILLKIEPDAMSQLFATWIGYITIFIILVLEILGLYSIKKIITINV